MRIVPAREKSDSAFIRGPLQRRNPGIVTQQIWKLERERFLLRLLVDPVASSQARLFRRWKLLDDDPADVIFGDERLVVGDLRQCARIGQVTAGFLDVSRFYLVGPFLQSLAPAFGRGNRVHCPAQRFPL